MTNVEDVLQSIRSLLIEGQWPPDWVVVVERIKVQAGFAVVCSKKGLTFDLNAHVGVGWLPDLEAYGGSVDLAGGVVSAAVGIYPFQSGATPIFSQAIRVRQSLWGKLLGLSPELLDPSGGVYDPAHQPPAPRPPQDSLPITSNLTPANLTHLPVARRFYDPDSSEISLSDVRELPLAALFEQLDRPMRLEVETPEPGKASVEDSFGLEEAWIKSKQTSALTRGVDALALGLRLQQEGDPAGAEAVYERAMECGDSDVAPRAAADLGILLTTSHGDVTRAQAALERAIESGHREAAPKSEFVLGILLERRGDKRGAERSYRAAANSGHTDAAPKAALNLGLLLEAEGDVVGAKAAFQRAIDSGHTEAAPRAKAALKNLTDKTVLPVRTLPMRG